MKKICIPIYPCYFSDPSCVNSGYLTISYKVWRVLCFAQKCRSARKLVQILHVNGLYAKIKSREIFFGVLENICAFVRTGGGGCHMENVQGQTGGEGVEK